MKPIFIAIISLIMFQCEEKMTLPEYEYHRFTAKNGMELPYRLLKPDNYDPSKSYPLVLFLHGSGERGTDNEAQLVHIAPSFQAAAFRKEYPCFAIFPQCPTGETWAPVEVIEGKWYISESSDPTRPMEALIEMMQSFIRENPVKRNQMYLGGLSMGGFGSLDMLRHLPDFFAAAVPICGGGNKRYVHEYQHVPIWLFHGAKDPVVPVHLSREMAEVFEGRGMRYKYTEYPEGEHDVWNAAWSEPDLIPWLWDQKSVVRD